MSAVQSPDTMLRRLPNLCRRSLWTVSWKPGSSGPLHLIVATSQTPDRPGIVSEVARIVRENGGSVSDSQSVKLQGTFTISMLVDLESSIIDDSVPDPSRTAQIKAALLSSSVENVLPDCVVAVQAAPTPEDANKPPAWLGRFAVEAPDKPGIIRKVASFAQLRSLNIDRMTTTLSNGSFVMSGVLSSTSTIDFPQLSKDAETLKASVEGRVKIWEEEVPDKEAYGRIAHVL